MALASGARVTGSAVSVALSRVLSEMSVLSETKHLAAGADFPPTKKDVLRLYSMKFCPYAERTRLVLAHRAIPHEVVNVNLKSKPDWFMKRNPLGLVPVLELNEKIVYESPICAEWLDEVYPEKKLSPTDPYAKAQWKMFAERFSRVITAFYKLRTATTDEKKHQIFKDLHNSLKIAEEALVKPFFGGDQVGLVDFHFWPWFERMNLMRLLGFDLSAANYPRLTAWIELMHRLPAVRAVRLTDKQHEEFWRSYASGSPIYDPEDMLVTSPPGTSKL